MYIRAYNENKELWEQIGPNINSLQFRGESSIIFNNDNRYNLWQIKINLKKPITDKLKQILIKNADKYMSAVDVYYNGTPYYYINNNGVLNIPTTINGTPYYYINNNGVLNINI